MEYSTIEIASTNSRDDVDEAIPLQIAPDETEVADYEEDAAENDGKHSIKRTVYKFVKTRFWGAVIFNTIACTAAFCGPVSCIM